MMHGVVHRELKEATADLHNAVEQQPCFSKLMAPNVSQSDVLAALRVFHLHYAAWEPSIFDSLADVAPDEFLCCRRRLPALQTDLENRNALNSPANSTTNNLSKAEALGWLYVHEGSRHGALVIRKHLERHLGVAFASKFTFFSFNSRKVADMWVETLQFIDQNIDNEEQLSRAILGARDAFSALHAAGNTSLERGSICQWD